MKSFTVAALALAALVASAAAHDTSDSCNSSGGDSVGIVDAQLSLASGLAASRKQDNVFWMVNGGPSVDNIEVFAVDATNVTNILGTVTLKGTKNTIDIQDIAVANEDDKGFIYVGDIGAAGRTDQNYMVYKFVEPMIDEIAAVENADITTFELKYQAGLNFQTLMVDNDATRTAYLVSRSTGDEPASVCSFEGKPAATPTESPASRARARIGNVITMNEEGTIAFTDIVAGEISTDKRILLKNSQLTFLFLKDDQKVIESLQSTDVCFMTDTTLLEQDSGITFSKDNKNYYTVGSGETTRAAKVGPVNPPVPVDPFQNVYKFKFEATSVEPPATSPPDNSSPRAVFSGLLMAVVAAVAVMA